MRVLVVDIGGTNVKILARLFEKPSAGRQPAAAKSTTRRKAAREDLQEAAV